MLDGVYRRTDGEPAFVEVPAHTDEALQAVLHKIIGRMMKLLTRRGVLVEDEGSTCLADGDAESDDARTLRPLQAAAWPCRPRRASGPAPRRAQPVHWTVCVRARLTASPSARVPDCKVFTVQGTVPRDAAFTQAQCADEQGFSLHAAVRCGAHERQRLEQLCRYITRPALANERVQCNAAGQVVLKLKTAWRDGTTHIVMSPLEFMQRLAALVPRPRLHLIHFHGGLAPSFTNEAKLRALVVPAQPQEATGESQLAANESGCAQHRPVRISRARLLKRVFEIDLEHCPNCGRAQDHRSHHGGGGDSSASLPTWGCRPVRRRGYRRASARCRKPVLSR